MSFIHLHNHSHYSLLDGLPKIKDLVSAAKNHGMSALAITDHGVMYGVIEFYQECLKQGIKPIIGVEFYLARRSRNDRKPGIDTKPYHLLLLAKNNQGYSNLLKLTSIAHLEGFYYKPRIDWELLEKYHEGLICSTACLNGQIPKAILSGDIVGAEQLTKRYKDLFGEDNFYLEMQYHPNEPDQLKVNNELIKLSKKYNVPLLATNDTHYINISDSSVQDILMCMQSKKKIDDKDRMNMTDFDLSFISPEKMMENFSSTPSAIENTKKIANMCNIEIELGITKLPHFDLPENETADSYLKKLCKKGIETRFSNNPKNLDIITERLNYELDVIDKTGYASYFLIVADFVNWAKEHEIVVGPGRGSAAGSLVSYLMNITDIDPLKYNLIFERFLNPERVSMPDVDIDFADVKRAEIIKYVEQRYGSTHVSQIITFGTMAARAAIRDVGRVLNFNYTFCDKLAKMIPMFTTLEEAMNTTPELKEAYKNDKDAKTVIDFAKKLEGVARHHSMHACGVLISKDELDKTVPLQYASSSDQTVISQYSLHPIEDLGLLKMDFLGLKNLTILEDVIDIIRKIHGKKIKLEDIDLEDKKTFSLFQKGQTTGVFQLESSGMKKYLKQLKPNKFEDIIAMVSLYRPGPMQFIPDFIDGKHGNRKIIYDDSRLKPILEETYGIAVYQEQVMEIAKKLAGFSYAEADVLRKAVGKKIKELLDEQKDKLILGMTENGISSNVAKKIWNSIEPFASYGFNKAHATCYALIAFQTAYFKANYPTEFMAALLTADQNDTEKLAFKIKEAEEMGIKVLAPDINKSYSTFTVLRDELRQGHKKIRFGLNAIKNLGENIVRTIIKERKLNGEFKNIEDFLSRIQNRDLNKKSLESLIKAGALNDFGDANVLLKNLDKLLEFNRIRRRENESNQSNIFSGISSNDDFSIKLTPYPSVDNREKLSWEKEMLGLYITGHPFKSVCDKLKDKIIFIEELKNLKSEELVKIGGIVNTIQKIVTKKNKTMLFVDLEDNTSSIEIVVFPKVLTQFQSLIQQDAMIIIEGRLSYKDDKPKILAENIWTIDDFLENGSVNVQHSPVIIKIENELGEKQIAELKQLFRDNKGMSQVYFSIRNNGGYKEVKTEFKIANSQTLMNIINRILYE